MCFNIDSLVVRLIKVQYLHYLKYVVSINEDTPEKKLSVCTQGKAHNGDYKQSSPAANVVCENFINEQQDLIFNSGSKREIGETFHYTFILLSKFLPVYC